jgi:hypothetical protein
MALAVGNGGSRSPADPRGAARDPWSRQLNGVGNDRSAQRVHGPTKVATPLKRRAGGGRWTTTGSWQHWTQWTKQPKTPVPLWRPVARMLEPVRQDRLAGRPLAEILERMTAVEGPSAPERRPCSPYGVTSSRCMRSVPDSSVTWSKTRVSRFPTRHDVSTSHVSGPLACGRRPTSRLPLRAGPPPRRNRR